MRGRQLPRLLAAVALAIGVIGQGAPGAAQTILNPADLSPGARGPMDENVPLSPGPPAGRQALPIDLFTSKNFYKDAGSWSDPRYFRCLSPRQVMDSYRLYGAKPDYPRSMPWGDCAYDYPRARIVSPYPYKTAKAHYEALLAAAKTRGGPTVYTKATTPDWDGYYMRESPKDGSGWWLWGTSNQYSTYLSLLTPEYQKRMVQGSYHEAVSNAPQHTASFCYPEGFVRWWSLAAQGGNFQLTMNPWQVQFVSGIAANFLRQVMIGQQHVQKVPQWYGETVGFWDGETLTTWTANVQPWIIHSLFEFSARMETVETYRPARDASGKFIGLDHEAVFYDPDVFVEPVHVNYRFLRQGPLNDPNRRFSYVECLSNIKNVNGRPTQVTAADPRFVDYYGRPWAQNWAQNFEKGWEKPDDNLLPSDVADLFK
jgi:hypothetical protein